MFKMDISQGTPSQGVSYAPIGITSTGKKGHSCCGGCCDVRRATVICNVLLIVMGFLGMIFLDRVDALIHSVDLSDDTLDDETKKSIYDAASVVDSAFNWAILRLTIGILCAGVSIYGAIVYNKFLVGANAVYLVLTMFHAGIISVAVNSCFIYPHVFLVYYMHIGIMSEDNYIEEQQSCCCV